jgi:nitroimidazol reductase NimA-like FMN-containing flavoprotein (pyridoxamine 5'-phosphate oxidase superfamily)
MSKDILDRVKALLREKESCVLATSRDDRPHCSLMVYGVDTHCLEMYMVTRREGTKYANLKQNANVSLLVDTRDRGETGPTVTALTLEGRFREIDDPVELTAVVQKLSERHRHLVDFMKDAETAVFGVRLDSFLLLEGLTDAHYGVFANP